MNRMNWPSMNRSQGDNELSIELHATNPVTSQAKTNLSGKNLEVLKKISSTFIVAEEDKQLITKMESDQLRTSVLQLNRPINPYYDSSSVRQLPKNPSTSSSLASSTTTPSPPYSSSSSPPSSINVSPKLPAEIGVLTKNNGGGRLNGGISRPRLSAINNKVGLQRRTETAAIFNEKPPSQQVRNTKLMAQAQQKKESSNKKPHQSEVLDTGLIEECARSTRQNIQLLEELEFEDFHRVCSIHY